MQRPRLPARAPLDLHPAPPLQVHPGGPRPTQAECQQVRPARAAEYTNGTVSARLSCSFRAARRRAVCKAQGKAKCKAQCKPSARQTANEPETAPRRRGRHSMARAPAGRGRPHERTARDAGRPPVTVTFVFHSASCQSGPRAERVTRPRSRIRARGFINRPGGTLHGRTDTDSDRNRRHADEDLRLGLPAHDPEPCLATSLGELISLHTRHRTRIQNPSPPHLPLTPAVTHIVAKSPSRPAQRPVKRCRAPRWLCRRRAQKFGTVAERQGKVF